MATLPVSSRSTSAPSAPGEVVQPPVELLEPDLKRVLLEHLLLRREQPRPRERQDGALDWAPAGDRRRRAIRVSRHELALAPGEDRRRGHLVGGPVDLQAVLPVDALRGGLGEL